HQIWGRVGEGFTEQAGRVDNMGSGHRDDAFRVEVRDFSKDHTATASTSSRRAGPPRLHHYAGLNFNDRIPTVATREEPRTPEPTKRRPKLRTYEEDE
uniref:hypothetical protein n=1 Tax=Marisediminicola senii TaxID=2711233 RepID=UPI001F3CD09B